MVVLYPHFGHFHLMNWGCGGITLLMAFSPVLGLSFTVLWYILSSLVCHFMSGQFVFQNSAVFSCKASVNLGKRGILFECNFTEVQLSEFEDKFSARFSSE